MAGMVLLYTVRIVRRAKVTMEDSLFGLRHDWQCLDSELFELAALSWGLSGEAV